MTQESQIKQLFSVIVNGNGDIGKASAELKELFNDYHSIPTLFQLFLDPNQGIRQLACVEARKLIQSKQGELWELVPLETREDIKQHILQLTIQEQSTLVRHSLAHVVAEIAKNESKKGRWTNLYQILYQSCSSMDPKEREMGVYVLYSLFEVIADTSLSNFVPELMELFSKTILDTQSVLVAVTSVQALCKVADFIQDEDQKAIKQFQSLIPTIVSVLKNCLSRGDDENVSKLFQVFDDLLLLEIPVLSKHFVDLINLFLEVAACVDYMDEIRVQALSFLMWCIMSARNKILKAKLIPNMINTMFTIAAEDQVKNDEDEPCKLAVQVLNTCATTFAPNQVFPLVMKLAIKAIQSSNPGDRKAAMLGIAVLVEGCADFMRPNINDMVQLVSMGLQDVDPMVRKSACTFLSALCQDFEEEMSRSHATLLPLLFNVINDQHVSVHPEALSTLDMLLEILGDDIIPYVPGLMNKLVSMWGSSSRSVSISVTNCIGSVAFAASKEFIPYFENVMNQLLVMLTMVDPQDLSLRSAATDCVGAVANAVGKDIFRPCLSQVMTFAIQGMQYDNTQLRQCSFVLFGVLGRVFENEFAPYLEIIVPPLFQSCKLEENDFQIEQDIDIGQEANDAPKFASGIVQEKESCIDTLGELFCATKSAFMPFLPESINTCMTLIDHYHESLRITCATTLLSFFNTAYEMGNPGEWEHGLPLKLNLHENVVNISKLAMQGILVMLSDEDERMVVTETLQAITETLKITGPAAICQSIETETHQESMLDLLANQLLLLLQQEHPCQEQDDSFEEDGDQGKEEDDDEMAELDALVLCAAADTVAALSAAVGPQFAPYFQRFLPLIARFYKPTKPVSDRSMAIGALAEVVQGMEQGIEPFANDLLQIFLNGMQDVEDEVKSNAAFGIGVLCTFSKDVTAPAYQQILSLLHPLFNPLSTTNMQDNACGCLSRMILSHSELVPLDICVPTLMKSLPLTKDFEENRPIIKALLELIKNGNQYLVTNIKDVFILFTLIEHGQQIHSTTREQIKEFLGNMSRLHTLEYQNVIGQLSMEQQQIIQKYQ